MPYKHEIDLSNPFYEALNNRFKGGDALNIVKTLNKLDIPLPESNEEYLSGNDGIIIFMDDYNVIVRIEDKEAFLGSRMEHPHILQPLYSEETDKAIIEILPGTSLEDVDDELVETVKEKLYEDGIHFWDDHGGNVGRLPISTPEFPDGVPIVIDRLAVEKMSAKHLLDHLQDYYHPDAERIVKDPREFNDYTGIGAQEDLFKPVREVFKKAADYSTYDLSTCNKTILQTGSIKSQHLYSNNSLASEFSQSADKLVYDFNKAWDICAEFKKEGLLIAGWHGKSKHEDTPSFVEDTAKKYSARVQKHRQNKP